MSLAETDKRALALIMVVIVLLASGAWYQMMYKPAQDDAAMADSSLQQAQQQVSITQAQLGKVQNKGADKSSVAIASLTRTAIPALPRTDTAIPQIEAVAKKTGVTIAGTDTGGDSSSASSGTTGDTSLPSVSITITGDATYLAFEQFMIGLEGLVDTRGSKVYVTGRLFNIVKWQVGVDSSGGDGSGPPIPKGHLPFTIVVQMFSQSAAGASGLTGSSGIGGTGAAGGAATTTGGAATTTGGAATTTGGAATTTGGAATTSGGATTTTGGAATTSGTGAGATTSTPGTTGAATTTPTTTATGAN